MSAAPGWSSRPPIPPPRGRSYGRVSPEAAEVMDLRLPPPPPPTDRLPPPPRREIVQDEVPLEDVRDTAPRQRPAPPVRRPRPPVPVARPSSRALLRRTLSTPDGLRQGFLLREVLDPPVSLRPGTDDRRG